MSIATAWCEAQVLDAWSSSVNEIGGFTSWHEQCLDQLIILCDVRALSWDQLYITTACQGYLSGILYAAGFRKLYCMS